MSENIKKGIRNWLNISQNHSTNIQINEVLDFETNAIKNRIWYRGDSNEIEQLYSQIADYADKYKFWASKCTPGMEMRKLHTGLPGLIVRMLTSIVLGDMNELEFTDSQKQESLWKDIAEDNKFTEKLEKALKEVLYIGDGAFKVTVDTKVSEFPILEWCPGDRIEIIRYRDRIKEIVFKTPVTDREKRYVLHERYGYGYVKNELYLGEKLVNLSVTDFTAGLSDYAFDEKVILAVPMKVYESTKYEGRGGSIYDGKLDSFDALDEAWSQWMDALRAGRAKTYVPDSFIPRDKETGELMNPNPFDNRFLAGGDNMSEGGKNMIQTEQPSIPHDSYLASYCTALDICLQGLISPSTLGIDVKKLDNAEAQREKEKATLYTRNTIVKALQETLPAVVYASINAYHILHKMPVEEVKVNIPFGEYANPSFESQVETVGKAKTQGIMSIEMAVEELYGDTLDADCKKEEIARLKAEQGIAEMEEPGINTASHGFLLDGREI